MENFNELPLGLGMAFAQHPDAMQNFSNMPEDEKQQIIQKAHMVKSKKEMNELVRNLSIG